VAKTSGARYCGNVPVFPLTLLYLLVFFIAVFARESYSKDNLTVFIVVALLLFGGLALWVYAARKTRE
jgi:hypothetical protein